MRWVKNRKAKWQGKYRTEKEKARTLWDFKLSQVTHCEIWLCLWVLTQCENVQWVLVAPKKKLVPPLPTKTGTTVRRSHPECGCNMFPETSVGYQKPTLKHEVRVVFYEITNVQCVYWCDWCTVCVLVWLMYSVCTVVTDVQCVYWCDWCTVCVLVWLMYSVCTGVTDVQCVYWCDWCTVCVLVWLMYSVCTGLTQLYLLVEYKVFST